MKNFVTTLVFLFFFWGAIAQIPAGYYNGTEGQEGYVLKTILHNIIDGHNSHSYDDLYDGYEDTDVDFYYENDGTVLDMYSENPTGPDPYNWTHQSNHCGNYQNEGDCFNREHLFPQGFFGSSSPMVSDIHFVVPTDGKVNGMRNNYPFGNVGTASWTSLNGSKRGSGADGLGYSGVVFEPIDEFKGDIARMMFYFITRYEGQLSGFDPNNSRNPLDGSENRGYEQWHVDLLMAWHNQDPVSQREIDRNNAAYDYQGNRNPFIDHPEWVECIWGDGCNSLQFTSSPVTDAMEGQSYTYNITYQTNNESETITCTQKPGWLTFSYDLASNTAQLSGTPSASHVGNHSVIIELSEGTETETQSFTVVVSEFQSIITIFDVDFSECIPSGWTTYSISSDEDWSCGTEVLEINAYGSSAACNDWFISPAVNFVDFTSTTFNFDTWTQYDDDGITDPEVKLFYSINYDGSGNPDDFSWTQLSYYYPQVNSESWTSSGNIDLSSITGEYVYFGFQYTSSGTAGSSSSFWKLDNISFVAEVTSFACVENINIALYPNPSNGQFTIENAEGFDVIISDVNGRTIEKLSINNSQHQIDISSHANGMYFIKFTNENTTATLKFVKQ